VTTICAGAPRHAVFASPAHQRLLDFANDRISASRVVLTRVAVDGHRFVVDGRREPVTGRLHWLVGLERRDLAGDPALTGAIDRAISAVRASIAA
jgi:hypothetical protein